MRFLPAPRLAPPLGPLASLVLLGASEARALDLGDAAGKPVQLDVTASGSVLYNGDNRNSRAGSVPRHIDDHWGAAYSRIHTQMSWEVFHAGLRLDGAWFFVTPEPDAIALDLLEERRRRAGTTGSGYSPEDASFYVQKASEASRELTTRYTDWLYPAKYYVGYTGRDVDVTVGDFYAQLGRGLVLSVRKDDALSSDTTIRGARATARLHAGKGRLRLTALGGALNPLRVDEASGRYLGVTPEVTPGVLSLTEAGMPRAQASPLDTRATPTLAPDRILGGEISGGIREVQLGLQGALLQRTLVDRAGTPSSLSPGAARSAEQMRTISASVSAPDLDGHGALYVEGALQGMEYPGALARSAAELPDGGHAIYASASASAGPVTVTGEGKHYRSFFPLQANVDIGRAPELSSLQYSSPPTTEAFWVDTELEGFNTCVTGGRLKTDVELGPRTSVFAWAGRYLTWAESVANERCSTADTNLNRVWDTAVGFEISPGSRKSRYTTTLGTRFDDADRLLPAPRGGETHVFYREGYLRHDFVTHLGGPFTLGLQGWNRLRHQTQGGATDPWIELQQLLSLDWAPHLSFGAGFEYTENPQFAPTYLSGTVTYRLDSSSSISLFAGQRRGGLRCVAGVCRIQPPFEGARVDATMSF